MTAGDIVGYAADVSGNDNFQKGAAVSATLDYRTIRNVLTRFFSVGGIAVAFSLVAFGPRAFSIHSIEFVIMANGVAIAVAYSTLKTGVFQNEHVAAMITMLFLFVILPLPLGGWGLVSVTSYLVGLTAAVGLYCSIVARHPLRGRPWRIFAAIVILGLADALVFFFLQVASLRLSGHPSVLSLFATGELLEGLLMTTVSSAAFEIAEWAVQLSAPKQAVVN